MKGEAMEVRDASAGYALQLDMPVVPEGYKQTEVGVIPEDWEVKKLGELANFRTGPFGSALHKSDYTTGGVPVINPMHIVGSKLKPTVTMTITEVAANKIFEFRLQHNDIVIGRRGDMGRCAVVSEKHAGWLCGTGSMIIRPSPGINPDFLQRVITTSAIISKIENASVGSTMINLNQATLSNLYIQRPSVKEQRAIATALSDVDALLEALDRLIAKKRDIKQAAMQVLLTPPATTAMENGEGRMDNGDNSGNSQFSTIHSPLNTRLPGFEGEWEMRPLENIADIHSGGTPSTTNQDFWNGGVAWCTPTDITALHGSKYLTETERTLSPEGLKASSAEVIPPNSIIMTTRATIGECAINTIPMTTNQGFKNLIPLNADSEFLFYLMTTQKQRLVQLCGGSTFLEVGKKQLQTFEVTLPSDIEEQTAIATVLSDMDTELEALQQRRAKTAALKQAMMQELLTGRTRLVEPAVQDQPAEKAQPGGRKANVYFMRSVLAAEIVDQLHEEPTFGHVKLEKMLFLVEHLCDVDTGSTYHRKAAGPYDNRALRSIDSQLRKQQWFDARKEDGRYRYVPLGRRGKHKTYFDRYFADVSGTFQQVLDTFRNADTDRCEIVATLFAAWRDLLRDQATVSDEMIVHEVLNNWHESKQRIPEDRWLKALEWMRQKGFVPSGTVVA